MVWGAISKKGKLVLLFTEACVKINQDYYNEHVLENQLFENAENLHQEDYFVPRKILRHSAKLNSPRSG
jgi:hypothetical protein